MNDSTIFAQYPTNFKFLSVCQYITTFGVILSNYGLIPREDQDHSLVVLNALLEYLHNSKNESEAKLQLLQQVLRGSDLYGGGENDTLDMIYVEETYQFIISKALFFDFGYIEGYLAGIINGANNINYFSLKKKVIKCLSENYASMSYCSSSSKGLRLTPVAVKKVFNDYIWLMLPTPEEDISIIDVNYMHAMVGLKIVRSVGGDTSKSSLQDYILIAREFDFSQDNSNQTHQMVIALFSTPALFFYAYTEKVSYRMKFENLLSRNESWIEIYKTFFSYLKSTFQKIEEEILYSSVISNVETAFSLIKDRKSIAQSNVRACCPDETDMVINSYVDQYMTHGTDIFCHCKVASLSMQYNDQFKYLRYHYNKFQKMVINKTLIDNNMLKIMNRKSTVTLTTVIDDRCPYRHYAIGGGDMCDYKDIKIKNDIYLLFAIIDEKGNTDYYAFRKVKTGLSVYRRSDSESTFANVVTYYKSLNLKSESRKILKESTEDYNEFIIKAAKKITDEFINSLKEQYYSPTFGEKVVKVFKSLVPFYNCIEEIVDNRPAEAVISCSLDLINLIPVAGQVGKYAAKISRSVAIELGVRYLSIQTLTELSTKSLPSLLQISEAFSKSIAKEIMTKNFLYDSGVTFIRVLDPGFELISHLSKYGFIMFQKMYRIMFDNLNKISKNGNLLTILKSMLKSQENNLKLASQDMGLVPKVLSKKNNFEVVRYLHPAGSHEFGLTCVSSFGKIAELRTVEGNLFKTPVIQEKLSGGEIFYRPYIPETGEVEGIRLKMKDNSILRPYSFYIDLGATDWNKMAYTRDYQVYHHRVNWDRTPGNSNPVDPSAPSTPNRNQPGAVQRGSTDQLRRPIATLVDTSAARINQPTAIVQGSTQQIRRPLGSSAEVPTASSTSNRNQRDGAIFVNIDEIRRQLPVVADAPRPSYRLEPDIDRALSNVRELVLSSRRPSGFNAPASSASGRHQSSGGAIPRTTDQLRRPSGPPVDPNAPSTSRANQPSDGVWVNMDEFRPIDPNAPSTSRASQRRGTVWMSMEEFNRYLPPANRDPSIWAVNNPERRQFPIDRDAARMANRNQPTEVRQGSTLQIKRPLRPASDAPVTPIRIERNYNNHIDDVLVHDELKQVESLTAAEKIITETFGDAHRQLVRPVYDMYQEFPEIRRYLIFQDFYVLHSHYQGNLIEDIHSFARTQASTYRLALQQAKQKWIKEDLTVYGYVTLSVKRFDRITWTDEIVDTFLHTIPFYSRKEFIKRYSSRTPDSSVKTLVLKLNIKDRTGIVDMSRVPGLDPEHLVLFETPFTVHGIGSETIGDQLFEKVLTLHDLEAMSSNARRLQMIEKLKETLSTVNIRLYPD